MAKLIYAAFTSLDGYVADETGLVDEYHLLIAPIIAGSGNPYMVHVRYRAKS